MIALVLIAAIHHAHRHAAAKPRPPTIIAQMKALDAQLHGFVALTPKLCSIESETGVEMLGSVRFCSTNIRGLAT